MCERCVGLFVAFLHCVDIAIYVCTLAFLHLFGSNEPQGSIKKPPEFLYLPLVGRLACLSSRMFLWSCAMHTVPYLIFVVALSTAEFAIKLAPEFLSLLSHASNIGCNMSNAERVLVADSLSQHDVLTDYYHLYHSQYFTKLHEFFIARVRMMYTFQTTSKFLQISIVFALTIRQASRLISADICNVSQLFS